MKPRLFFLAICLGAITALAQPLPVGPSRFPSTGAEPLMVYTYKPTAYAGGPLLVVFHGVDRNAEDYRNFAIGMAERFKTLMIAPEFDAERFKTERYQRGGLLRKGRPQPKDQWTYSIVHRLVTQVRIQERRPDLPYYLIGHSAGAQFLARLAAPLTLLLGTRDTKEDANLDGTPPAMKQGTSRLERGRACFELARQLAASRRWAFHWTKIEIQDVGHSAAKMFGAREVEAALFSTAP